MACQGCNQRKKIFSWIGGVVPGKRTPQYGDQKPPTEHYRRMSENAANRRNKGSTN